MAGEVSGADHKFVQGLLASRKEESMFVGHLDHVVKGKPEKYIIVITKFRMFSIKSGSNKLAQQCHLLEIEAIKSHAPTELDIKTFKFELSGVSAHVDAIITAIRRALSLTFPSLPENHPNLDVRPSSRLEDIPQKELLLGGFVDTYSSLCDFQNHVRREEICWDMEHTYVRRNIKEFDLSEFEQPISPADMRALLGALRFNKYFRTLIADSNALGRDQIGFLAEGLRHNSFLEELVLKNIGLKHDFVTMLTTALSSNKDIALNRLDLSDNPLEDKGLIALSNYIQTSPRGIVSLDVSNGQAGKTGAAALAAALKKNVKMPSTLTHLNLSGNKLESEGTSGLAAFLSTPNALRTLILANTSANLELIFPAIMRGCAELRTLDVSHSKITKKEAPHLARLASSSATLKTLNLAGTLIPVDSLKEVLGCIVANPYMQDVVLDLKENALGLPGALMIQSIAAKITNIVNLDLSDNDLGDEGVSAVCDGLCASTSIRRLVIGVNFKVSKNKPRPVALESIASLIESDCPLTSLNIVASHGKSGSGGALKQDLIPLVYALATNDSLLELDLSGHQMGNKGAIALGKALQTNTTLSSLVWDDNGTTLEGFKAFRTGLERNSALKHMPLPLADIIAAKGDLAAVQHICTDIERLLGRNQSPTGRFESDAMGVSGAFMALLTSGQQQQVDKILMRIKATGKHATGSDLVAVQDAEGLERVIGSLHMIGEEFGHTVEEEVSQNMRAAARSLSEAISDKKDEITDRIIASVGNSLKGTMDSTVLRRLQTAMKLGAKEVDIEAVEKVLVKAAGAEVGAKAKETFLSAVEIATDYIYEKVSDRLSEVLENVMNDEVASPVAHPPATSAVSASPAASPAPSPSPSPAPATTPSASPSTPSAANTPPPVAPRTNAPPPVASRAHIPVSEQKKPDSVTASPALPSKGSATPKLQVDQGMAAAIMRGLAGPPASRPPRESEPEPEVVASPTPAGPSTPNSKPATPTRKLMGRRPTMVDAQPPVLNLATNEVVPSVTIGKAEKTPAKSEPVQLEHMTKDRVAGPKSRKPPSRRPRPPPS